MLTVEAEAPHGRMSTKFCTAVEVVDVITCDKCFSDRLRDVDVLRSKMKGSH